MAEANHTSRRSVFAILGAAAAVSVLPGSAQAAVQSQRWEEFIRGMAFAHRNGERVARIARESGVDLDDLFVVMMKGMADTSTDHRPTLIFDGGPGKPSRIFTPKGEEVSGGES